MNTSIVAVILVFVGISLNHVEAGVTEDEEKAMREYVEAFITYRKLPTPEHWAAVEAIKPRLPANYFTATMIVKDYTKATPNLLFSRVNGVLNGKERGTDLLNIFSEKIGTAQLPIPDYIANHAVTLLHQMSLVTLDYSNFALRFFSVIPLAKDAEASDQDKRTPTNYLFIMGGKP